MRPGNVFDGVLTFIGIAAVIFGVYLLNPGFIFILLGLVFLSLTSHAKF